MKYKENMTSFDYNELRQESLYNQLCFISENMIDTIGKYNLENKIQDEIIKWRYLLQIMSERYKNGELK